MENPEHQSTRENRRLPAWFKIAGSLTLAIVVAGIIITVVVVLGLWFVLWLIGKVAPAL